MHMMEAYYWHEASGLLTASSPPLPVPNFPKTV